MRKILLFTILIVGYYVPTYSQINSQIQKNQFQIDTTFKGLTLKYNFKTPQLFENKDLDWMFNDTIPNKKAIIGQGLFATNKTRSSFDNMPCVIPKGFSPMPIYIPDSTRKYTLLIKR